jgi:DNA-binding winged helix-turn-helix (wHTH) protein
MLTIGGRTVHLSATEYQLIRLFLARANRPVHKQELLHHVWGDYNNEPSNVVELAIARLRRKIEENPAQPCRLVTVRSVGYQLRLPAAEAAREAAEPPLSDHHSLRGHVAAGVSGLPRIPTRQSIN